jgi:hypothetical protein
MAVVVKCQSELACGSRDDGLKFCGEFERILFIEYVNSGCEAINERRPPRPSRSHVPGMPVVVQYGRGCRLHYTGIYRPPAIVGIPDPAMKQKAGAQTASQSKSEIAVIWAYRDRNSVNQASQLRRQPVSQRSKDYPLNLFFPAAMARGRAEAWDDQTASTPPAMPLPSRDTNNGNGEERGANGEFDASDRQPEPQAEQRPVDQLRNPKVKAPRRTQKALSERDRVHCCRVRL